MNIITEEKFKNDITQELQKYIGVVKSVTGPGRSGAVASVYASYILGVPFIPYGTPCPDKLRPILICDTTYKTGKTIRAASRKYDTDYAMFVYLEPPRAHMWFEKIVEKYLTNV